jgi:hypothetical protein
MGEDVSGDELEGLGGDVVGLEGVHRWYQGKGRRERVVDNVEMMPVPSRVGPSSVPCRRHRDATR